MTKETVWRCDGCGRRVVSGELGSPEWIQVTVALSGPNGSGAAARGDVCSSDCAKTYVEGRLDAVAKRAREVAKKENRSRAVARAGQRKEG